MKQKAIVVFLMISFIIPSFAVASWWNPFSWHFRTKVSNTTNKSETSIYLPIKNEPTELRNKEIKKADFNLSGKNLIGDKSNSATGEIRQKQEGEYSIKIVSPNGGEEYVAGQHVDVKWRSKNIPSDASIFITIKGFDEEVWISTTRNTGVDSIVIPLIPFTPRFDSMPRSWNYGKFFMIGVAYKSDEGSNIKDYSDGYFAINKDQNKIVEPEVVTTSVNSITPDSATINGSVKSNDPTPAQAWYHCSKDSEFKSSVISSGDMTVPKSSSLVPVKFNFPTEINKGETYYCRIVASNSAGTGLGNSIKFAIPY